MSIRLETKKWYQTRDKRLIKIVEICSDKRVVNPFRGNNEVDYFPDGKLNLVEESPFDLIREISHIGNLIEIIAEEGLKCRIEGGGELGLVAEVSNGTSYRSIEYGGNTEAFETLIAAYLKYIR